MLDGELLEEVECFNFLVSKVTVDIKNKPEVLSNIYEIGKVLGGMNRYLSYIVKSDSSHNVK